MYDLTDWAIDLIDFGRCLNCKGRTLERHDTEIQCYSCGRWASSAVEFGRSECELMHLATSSTVKRDTGQVQNVTKRGQQHDQEPKDSGAASYSNMKFCEELERSSPRRPPMGMKPKKNDFAEDMCSSPDSYEDYEDFEEG